MSLIRPLVAPHVQSASVSSATISIGSSYRAVPLHARTYRIGSGRILSDGRQLRLRQIGGSQLDIESILSNNASGDYRNTDNITNQSIPLKNQPTPLIFTDFSKEARNKIVDILLSSKMESQVDRLLLRKMVELLEKDASGSKLLNGAAESIKNELKSSNELLDALGAFYEAYLNCNSSFELDSMSANAALIFESNIASLKVSNSLIALKENYDSKSFVSVASALTSYSPMVLQRQGLHAAFWLGLRDAYDSVKFGVSPGFLIEQNKRGDSVNNIVSSINEIRRDYNGIKSIDEIGLASFSIDTLNDERNYSIDRIPYITNLSSIDKVIYYCSLISSEFTVSVGMGITDGTVEGQRFGALSDPISVSLGAPSEGPNYLGTANSIFSTARIDSDGKFASSDANDASYLYEAGSNKKSSKSVYIDTILSNPLLNQASIYEKALNSSESLFQEVENFLKNVMQNGNSKKSLVTKSGLFSRVVSDFGMMLENLGTGNGDPTSMAIHFAMMRKLAGVVPKGDNDDSKKKLKILNQKMLASKLKASLPENYSEDLIAQSKTVRIIHGNVADFGYDSNRKLLKEEMDFIIEDASVELEFNFERSFSENKFVTTVVEMNQQSSSKRNDNIYDVVVRIVKDIEDECHGLINSFKPFGTFLRSNGTTKYSGFDSLTLANMIYECFAILANAFTDVFIKDNTNKKIKRTVGVRSELNNIKPSKKKSSTNENAITNSITNTTINATLINTNDNLKIDSKYQTLNESDNSINSINTSTNILRSTLADFSVRYSGYSTNLTVGKLEKSGRFLNALAAAVGNKNTDFLINKSETIATDNVTRSDFEFGFGEKITPNDLVEAANRVLSEDDVFWNLYALSKSVFTNVKNSSARMVRYGKLLNPTTVNSLEKIEKSEQQVVDFVKDASLNPVEFISSMNTVALNRAKLRLREIESLQKPYDLAELPDQIYDACKLFVSSKSSYVGGKILIFGLAKEEFSDILDVEGTNPSMKARIARKSEFEPEVKYEDFQAPRLLLKYIATEDEVVKAVTRLTADENYSYSLESLALETKYYDMHSGDYVSLNSAAEALPIMESYLACKLLEICFDVSLEPHVFNSGGLEWNQQLLRSTIGIVSSILDIDNLFDYMFIDNGNGTISPRSAEQVNSKLGQETIRYDAEGKEYYENSGVDSARMSLVHSLLDTLYFKAGLVKKMVFARDVFDGIYAVNFDQESMQLSNGSKTKKLLADFVDAYYVAGDIS